MLRRRAFAPMLVAALAWAPAACVRAPAPLDVTALVRERGADQARGLLAVRILDNPRDVQARLALAKLADETGRPSQAIEQLDAVLRIGGPLGTRWHAEDRARLARLLAVRGRVRLARGSPTALADLQRARELGAAIDDVELQRARAAIGLAALRHVDADERERGRRILVELVGSAVADPSWLGAKPDPVPHDRGLWGIWLWQHGARRAGWEALRAWRETTAERDGEIHDAYLRAYAWWHPVDAPPPPPQHLVGRERCRFAAAGCTADDVLAGRVPPRAAAIGAAAADLPTRPYEAAVAAYVRAHAPAMTLAPPATDQEAAPLVASEPHALTTPRPDARIGEPTTRTTPQPERTAPARPPATTPERILTAYRRDPAIADRHARDFVAESPDDAAAQATLGTLFDALADPARARAAWEAAVQSSDEPAFVRGLALAIARAGDPDAALVHGTRAAAAAGDPASVWIELAHALDAARSHPQALEAARYAIELAGDDTLAAALDIAATESDALGRTAQATDLRARRARLASPSATTSVSVIESGASHDANDAAAAVTAYKRAPTASAIARLWVASRANPRDVPVRAALRTALDTTDARLRVIIAELLALASDPDALVGRAAVAALR